MRRREFITLLGSTAGVRPFAARAPQAVIVTGTASNAAVLFTAAGAAQRGMNAIVPVDGMSGIDAYADLTTAYMIATAPVISAKSTLTKIDMIKF